jgi:nucleotide-binding universal stress UspA family protein
MPKVLVALDESELSVHVARVAKDLFAGTETKLLAISVATVPTLWADPFGGVHTLKGDPDGDDDILTEDALEHRVADVMAEADLQPDETLMEVGAPVERICAAAEDFDVDVIVVGTHDKGFFRRMIDPLVSEGVLTHTTRPVIIVHPPTDA